MSPAEPKPDHLVTETGQYMVPHIDGSWRVASPPEAARIDQLMDQLISDKLRRMGIREAD